VVIICVAALTGFYLGLMLHFTGGRLYFEQDLPGFYNLYDVFLPGITLGYPSGILANLIYGGSFLVGGSNFYIGDYIAISLSLALTLVAWFLLTRILLKGTLDGTSLTVASVVSCLLFVVGPVAIANSKTSFANGPALPSEAFAVLFMACSIALARARPRSLRSDLPLAAMLGVSMLFSLAVLPTLARNYLLQFLLFYALVILYGLLRPAGFRLDSLRLVGRRLLLGSAAMLLAGLVAFLPMILNPSAYLPSIHAAASSNADLSFYVGQFNSMAFSIRLFGNWEAPFSPYYALYSTPGLIAYLSFLWPTLLFGSWVAAIFHRRLRLLAPGVLVTMVLLFWYTAGNPPLGQLWTVIISVLPFGYQLLPPDQVIGYLEAFYYSFVALAIVWASVALIGRVGSLTTRDRHRSMPGRPQLGVAQLVVVGCVTGLLVASMAPVFTGAPETISWNGIPATYVVPPSYTSVRTFLMDRCTPTDCSTLLLPQTGAYVILNWGSYGTYWGIGTFYQLYFAPVTVLGSGAFGGTFQTSSQAAAYQNLTSPVIIESGTSNLTLNPRWLPLMEDHLANFIIVDHTSSLTSSTGAAYLNASVSYLLEHQLVHVVLTTSILTVYSLTASKMDRPPSRPAGEPNSESLFPGESARTTCVYYSSPTSRAMGSPNEVFRLEEQWSNRRAMLRPR
jgi:hypothetical protein